MPKQHVEFCPTKRPTSPPTCSKTPFLFLYCTLDGRFSAAMKLSRLLPAKWGRGLALVGGEISLKAMAEAKMELLDGHEPVLHCFY
jgi:hypothetical protein